MALDQALEDALHAAVAQAGQPKPVAQRLVAWLKTLSDGERSEDQNLSFYENVMSAIIVEAGENED